MAADKEHLFSQFQVKPIVPIEIGGYDLSLTNSGLMMLVAIMSITLFMVMGARKNALVPGRLQNMAELSYNFIGNMVKENIGVEDARKYMPFMFTVFMFILFCNLLGMIPHSFFHYGYTVTSQIIITFALAILVFLTVVILGLIKHGFHFFTLFVPSGLPKIMIPLLIPIELVSFLARPISLSIRLAAAMTAGHILLEVFAGFIVSFITSYGILGYALGFALPMPMLVFFVGLEFFICFLQAYIFAMLTSIYLHDAVHLH